MPCNWINDGSKAIVAWAPVVATSAFCVSVTVNVDPAATGCVPGVTAMLPLAACTSVGRTGAATSAVTASTAISAVGAMSLLNMAVGFSHFLSVL